MFSHYISYFIPFRDQVLLKVYVVELRFGLVVVDSPIDWRERRYEIVYLIKILVQADYLNGLHIPTNFDWNPIR